MADIDIRKDRFSIGGLGLDRDLSECKSGCDCGFCATNKVTQQRIRRFVSPEKRNFVFSNPETHRQPPQFAKKGFRGTVNMKTLFTVGEGGKKEHVTRKKKNNIFDVGFDF
jgi:hypothetical protein